MVESFDRPNGKFPDLFGNVAVLDSKQIIPLVTAMFETLALRIGGLITQNYF